MSRIKYSITGFIIAVGLGLFLLTINALQTLSLVIRPFSPRLFRSANRFFANTFWGSCAFFMEIFQGIKIVTTGDPLPGDENAMLISNHQTMGDIPMILCLGWHHQRAGDLKWFIKDILKYVPGVGWGVLFLDCLLVKRDWTRDRDSIESTFKVIKENKVSIWLVSFLEGTRLTPTKLRASQAYATQQGLPPLRHVLFPRTKGFVASVRGLGTHLDAIYDLTLGYPDRVPSLWDVACGNLKPIHLHIRRFEVSTLPQDDVALANWVKSLYQEKDALLETFYQKGYFVIPQASPPPSGKSAKVDLPKATSTAFRPFS